MGKIHVYDKIMIENQKKRENMGKSFTCDWNSQLMPQGVLTSFTVCDAYCYFVGQA